MGKETIPSNKGIVVQEVARFLSHKTSYLDPRKLTPRVIILLPFSHKVKDKLTKNDRHGEFTIADKTLSS